MTWGFVLLCLLGVVLFLIGLLVVNKYVSDGLEKDIVEAEERREEMRSGIVIELGHSPAPPGYIVDRMDGQISVASSTSNEGSHQHSLNKWKWHSAERGTHEGFDSRYEAIEDAWGDYYMTHERKPCSLTSEGRIQ